MLWVGFVSIKISVFGGENCVKPGNSGLESPDTPSINPDTPEIPDVPD